MGGPFKGLSMVFLLTIACFAAGGSFGKEGLMIRLKRTTTTSKSPLAQYHSEVEALVPNFSKASAGMFDHFDESTVETIAEIRALHATYPVNKPKACVFILAMPTHCGDACVRGNKHDQSWNIMNMLGTMENQFMQKFRYPVVIYHEDYNDEQKKNLQSATKSKIFWFKIQFGPAALPDYYDMKAVMKEVGANHEGGDINKPHSRGKFHGFGYRTMCRFYGGLVFHSPLVREFDYYWRVDGGDSRINWKNAYDLFDRMQSKGYLYGYRSIGSAGPSPKLDGALAAFRSTHPEVTPDASLLAPFVTSDGSYTGKYYYNNFEIAHIPTFQQPMHWELFMGVDKTFAFILGPTKQNGLGDADFRSMTVAYIMKKDKVHDFEDVGYQHPVAWDAKYNPLALGKK
jgi:alpha 1,2-mannosyltransferase